jgi:hypothetical protein
MVPELFVQYSTYRGAGTGLVGLVCPKVAGPQSMELQPRLGAAVPVLPTAPNRTICLANLVAFIIVMSMSGTRLVENGVSPFFFLKLQVS